MRDYGEVFVTIEPQVRRQLQPPGKSRFAEEFKKLKESQRALKETSTSLLQLVNKEKKPEQGIAWLDKALL